MLLGLAVWTWQFADAPMGATASTSILHVPNLVFHEAGHVLLVFFGRLQLVLLGGRTGAEVEGHDWEYLLTALGWLRFDRTLGLWAHRVGLLMMLGAVIWGAIQLAKHRADQLPAPSPE